MKIVHPILSTPIKFMENQIQVLTIENPLLFRDTVTSLISQQEGYEGPFILSVDDKIIDTGSSIHVIYDYFHLNVDKKLHNKLNTVLLEDIRENMPDETRILFEDINKYMNKVALFSDYPIAYDQCDNVSSLLKAFNFRIDLEEQNSIDSIFEVIKLYNLYFKNKCFIMINAKSFFTEEELIKFYSMIIYHKINLLLIESHYGKSIIEYEHHRLIDNDMCELYLDNK